jgi:hypothetical protein
MTIERNVVHPKFFNLDKGCEYRAVGATAKGNRTTRADLKLPKSKSVGQRSYLTQPNPDGVGSVEQAVLDEIAPLAKAAERRAAVAGARAMASILDDDALVAMHPQAARHLQVMMNELHSPT